MRTKRNAPQSGGGKVNAERDRSEAGSLVSKIDSFLLAVRRWEYKVADGAWFIKSDARGREEGWGGKFELGLVGSTIDRSEIRGSKRNFARLCLRPNEREEKRREEKRREETGGEIVTSFVQRPHYACKIKPVVSN
ncbi:hypothetical protein K0M31_011296 [Melipona bicolor]|uniref:Uncharacterized protein n=1 Tax=Melipona bicolor TaxID=60889 RepID=A0AA40KUH6_9HYME|nr:hypothetical protein K0M31_011296 [Melipona bicolor]